MYESALDESEESLLVDKRLITVDVVLSNESAIVEAGIALLKAKGLNASVSELTRISRLFDNQPMALALLGNYLREVYAGDPARLDAIPIWLDPHEEGRHVRRMLAAYSHWLQDTPEIATLFLLSLASRPVSPKECRELACHVLNSGRKGWFKHSIPSVFRPLKKLSAAKYKAIQARLSELDLLPDTEESGLLFLDPVVRDYFYQQLQIRFPDVLKSVQEMHDVDFVLMTSHNVHNEMQMLAQIEKQLETDLQRKNWQSATRSASRLSKRQRMLGNLPLAVQYARQSAAYAVLCADQSILRQSLQVLVSDVTQKPVIAAIFRG